MRTRAVLSIDRVKAIIHDLEVSSEICSISVSAISSCRREVGRETRQRSMAFALVMHRSIRYNCEGKYQCESQ